MTSETVLLRAAVCPSTGTPALCEPHEVEMYGPFASNKICHASQLLAIPKGSQGTQAGHAQSDDTPSRTLCNRRNDVARKGHGGVIIMELEGIHRTQHAPTDQIQQRAALTSCRVLLLCTSYGGQKQSEAIRRRACVPDKYPAVVVVGLSCFLVQVVQHV